MLHSVDRLRGYDIAATDGSIGDVHDVYFDDRHWTVRYFVVDTGRWLPGRKVLISPEAVKAIDPAARQVAVGLTREEVKESPGIAHDLSLSRQKEVELARYFRWSRYWEVYPAGVGAAPLVPPLDPVPGEEARGSEKPEGDTHLRSAKEVDGYHIDAKDGEIGHVSDFLIDGEGWQIRYLVVSTRNWLPGRKVLVAPECAEGISWSSGTVRVRLTRDQIKESPEFKEVDEVDRDYETRLYTVYGHIPYWH